MQVQTIVKIDLAGSKAFAAARESMDPAVRTATLKKLLAVSRDCFPGADEHVPKGTLYKADGDAIYYVITKSSVALRGAIEFMRSWFAESSATYPDCRVFLDRGPIDTLEVNTKVELTGRPFEIISVLEKGRPEGRIYVTREVVNNLDATMAKFSYVDTIPFSGSSLELFAVDFDDPRTVEDSSLVHALFVAHPKAAEARERVFELFLIEFISERGPITSLADFRTWAHGKGYSVPSAQAIAELLSTSRYFAKAESGAWQLDKVAKADVEAAKRTFQESRTDCIQSVQSAVTEITKKPNATSTVDMGALIEDYLGAIFSEIRIMANYFRTTLELFDSPPGQLERFDYVIRRQLDTERLAYFHDWRRGFLAGLQKSAKVDNPFIASVFHNVLATYYLNRSTAASAYQTEKLQQRQVFLDTNVFYSLMVEASNFHESTAYFIERLAKLGVMAKLLPISLNEYEESLMFVVRSHDSRGPSPLIVQRNPWLYQQFQLNPGRYLKNIALCRAEHSIAQDGRIDEEHFDQLDERLHRVGVQLEREWLDLSQEDADKMWDEHRNLMTSSRWTFERYWDFIQRDFPESVRRHDMTCIATLARRAGEAGNDALGPKVVFVTIDGKLWRLRKKYQFICSPAQFLEFILPYLFLSDIPTADPRAFPNRLLSAQLGTLLVQRPPELAEIARAYFQNPALAKEEPKKAFPGISDNMARVLSSDRFKQTIAKSKDLPERERLEMAELTTPMLEEVERLSEQMQKTTEEAKQLQEELATRDATITDRDAKIEKLQKTVAYFREQARRK
jgi:hypothetical protein